MNNPVDKDQKSALQAFESKMPYLKALDLKSIFISANFSSNRTHEFTIIAFQPYPQIGDPSALTAIVSLFEEDSLLQPTS